MGCVQSTHLKGVRLSSTCIGIDLKKDDDELEIRGYTVLECKYRGLNSQAFLVKKNSDLFLAKIVELEHQSQLKEVEILKSLTHPHIVKLWEWWSTSYKIVMILEYCENGDLRSYLNSHPRPPYIWVFRWISQLCLSLHYVHKMNIVHYDLKLDNVMLDRHLCVKLGDFGISEAGTVEDVAFRGTVGYICPEMCSEMLESYRAETWASDAWGLGCILHELIYEGSEAFPVTSTGLMATTVSTIIDRVGSIKKAMLNAIRQYLPEIHSKNSKKINSLQNAKHKDDEIYYSLMLRHLLGALLQPKPCERPSLRDILVVFYCVEFQQKVDHPVHPTLAPMMEMLRDEPHIV